MRPPSGKETQSKRGYLSAWLRRIRAFERATDTTVTAFDPTLSGHSNGDMNATFQIPVWLANRIANSKFIKMAERKG